MNRLGVYDVDAAFEKLSLQTAEEFGLDAILEGPAAGRLFVYLTPCRQIDY